MKKKYLLNYIIDISNFIEKHIHNEEELTKKNYKKIYLSIIKSQLIIKLFISCHIIIYKISTLFLKNKKIKLLFFQIFYKYNLFKFQKIVQLTFALKQLSDGNEERLIKDTKYLNKFVENTYYENIIIGSGPSGCITGLKLSKAGFKTLIIEKGNKYSLPEYKHPISEFQKKWKYAGISGALGNYDFQYSSGECVGGGSEINSGLYHELDAKFLNKLKINNQNNLLTMKDFEWEHLLSKNEDKKNSLEEKNLKNYFLQGATKLKYKIENLKTFYKNEKKNSMSKTILEDAVKYGCELLSNTEVIDFKKEGENWNINILFNRKKKKIFSKRLFLCCGAPYSLNLIKKSNYLKKNFNQDFHFHPMIKLIAKFPEKVNSITNTNVINTQISEFYPNYLFGNAASNLEFLKIFALGNNRVLKDVENNYNYMSIFHVTYSLGTSSFVNLPYIDQNIIRYKFSKNELKIIKEGLHKIINFIFECGAEYIYIQDRKISKVNKLTNYQEVIENYKYNFSSVHLLGGLKFGNNKDAILNSFGKFKDKNLDNLFVNDSSLLTEKLLKNPQGAIMSIASQNIDQIINNFND